ncbi:hypothetical protein K450DRAFT_221986 [Umbelopsis ramanniana AG]|uniref:Uncharacterized protein n=1 Tax=Umbelopsis ramanniana AG TaxID=1314678 RepID=A0AAD5EHM5_UMBRA|nr:uncharacterized protein K450DRAFT_221986 [Umbelopsis ramanniana AG]KAI8583612.1 hypothetical protein K450DRAFT_221986 [Umbelopsis ramanniana AG]
MILCEADNSTPTGSYMQNEETMMEKPSQPMDIEEEGGNDDDVLVPSTERHQSRKIRGPYRRYTGHQIEQLFSYVIEQGQRNTTSEHTMTMTNDVYR